MTISVRLVGTSKTEGRAQLDHFANLVQSLNKCMDEFERCVTNKPARIKFQVSELELKNAKLAIIPILLSTVAASVAPQSIELFNKTVLQVERGETVDERVDDAALRSLRKLFIPVERGSQAVEVNGLALSTHFVENIEASLSVDYTSYGCTKGKLETVTIHGKQQFALYPHLGKHKIVCEFEEDLLEDVTMALREKRHVTVTGRMSYKKGSAFPSHVEVAEIEVHPKNRDLPKLSTLCGAWSGPGLDSVSSVRKIRDEY